MPVEERKYLDVSGYADTRQFAPRSRRSDTPKFKPEDRVIHSKKLLSQIEKVWSESSANKQDKKARSIDGTYIDFYSAPAAKIAFKSFDSLKPSGIRILNTSQNDKGKQKITAFFPNKEYETFKNKVDRYSKDDTEKGKPCNEQLVAPIDEIVAADVESLWTDLRDKPGDNPEWCEIWIDSEKKSDDDTEREDPILKFRKIAKALGIEVSKTTLLFPERSVILAKTSYDDLKNLIRMDGDLAEFRRASMPAGFWIRSFPQKQREMVDVLLKRVVFDKKSNISVCILDTGVNSGHKLLDPLMPQGSCMTVDPSWKTSDNSGHGTKMAGLVGYGEFEPLLSSESSIEVKHFVESVKILPEHEQNQHELYGSIVQQAFSRATTAFPNRTRIGCMAVTAKASKNENGMPSSWSAAIDSISAGSNDEKEPLKLIFISAGNVEREDWNNYIDSNTTSPIEDPGQSWNAITVGAYTNKVITNDPSFSQYQTVAQAGALSPFSRTSSVWDAKKRPLKPEIVMEGGNVIKVNNIYDTCDDLSLLTTSNRFGEYFTTINATSSATALAANLAAKIQSAFPAIWPETVRALMVNSARWTEEMKKTLGKSRKKISYVNLVRTYGYGVPDFNRAVSCMQNTLTLVSEKGIQPFKMGSNGGTMKEMHLYELPWPKKELQMLGDLQVRIIVTLSYFISPAPGSREQYQNCNYASYQLQFYMNKPNETKAEFMSRINKLDEIEGMSANGTYDKWKIGQAREVGSIHSDIWEGTAAEAASQNLIAVVPGRGWWKTRKKMKKIENKARYSLVISMETDPCDTDIYTVVKQQIVNRVMIPISIKS